MSKVFLKCRDLKHKHKALKRVAEAYGEPIMMTGDACVDLGTLDVGEVTDCIIESQRGLKVSKQDKICTTIKEFITAVKAQRSGESK